MGDHDRMQTEDGWVVCRCSRTFSDNTTEEAMARHRLHFEEERRKADEVAQREIAALRRQLEGRG